MDDIFRNIKTEFEEVDVAAVLTPNPHMWGGTETSSSVALGEKIVKGKDIFQFDFKVPPSVDLERPRKKQRVIMEVVVPTRKKKIDESQVMKLKKLFKVRFSFSIHNLSNSAHSTTFLLIHSRRERRMVIYLSVTKFF